ncbi:hypothetical protein PJI17_33055, partial [Mycobacterium kansasii]
MVDLSIRKDSRVRNGRLVQDDSVGASELGMHQQYFAADFLFPSPTVRSYLMVEGAELSSNQLSMATES